MAKKSRLEAIENLKETEEQLINDIIIPAIEKSLEEKILDLREKGFDDNRIAAMLLVHKHIVEQTK